MDKELKATIFALLNELEELMGTYTVSDQDVIQENLAFVREGLEYL